MRRIIDKFLKNYGTRVSILHDGDRTEVRAIFMPTASRSWQNMEFVYTPLGETPRGQYNYIGPAGTPADAGDMLLVGEKRYLLRRAEEIRDNNGVLYRWGLCVEKGDDDIWGA